MKTASAKAKGRSLAKKVAEWLRKFAALDPRDVQVTSSGVTGPDITFSALGANEWPFAIECKKHASFAVYSHYDQAVEHSKDMPGAIPLLVIEANRKAPLVVIDACWFFSNYALMTKWKEQQ